MTTENTTATTIDTAALLANPDSLKAIMKAINASPDAKKVIRDSGMKGIKFSERGSQDEAKAEALRILTENGLVEHACVGHIKMISEVERKSQVTIKVYFTIDSWTAKAQHLGALIPLTPFGGAKRTDEQEQKLQDEIEAVKIRLTKGALASMVEMGTPTKKFDSKAYEALGDNKKADEADEEDAGEAQAEQK
jgi:hypothetical protein